MFFSIIIPTYNPTKYLPRLLESITHNNCLDDIEIIISDDCSTESFDDVVLNFKNILNIRRISNDKHYGFPMKGREHGSQEANGTWICFSDQDDYFIDGCFDKLKNSILKSDVHKYIACAFLQENSYTGERTIVNGLKGWTHGKFYEKAFIRSHDIHYDDLQYCEDTNLSTKVQCIMIDESINILTVDEPVYVWCRRKDSLADSDYFLKSMPDYVRATLDVVTPYVEKYANGNDLQKLNDFCILYMRTFLHCYFYLQTKTFRNHRDAQLEAILCIQKSFERFKSATGTDNKEIVSKIENEMFDLYNETRESDCKQIPFIEEVSFKEWLNVYF